jgi:serine phosphatase RsbU (regulator of sigma subunit)
MMQLIRQITNIGCNASLDEFHNKQLRLTNNMMLVQIVASIVVLIAEFFNDDPIGSIISFCCLVIGITVIVGNHYQKRLLAKLLLTLYAPPVVLLSIFVSESGVRYPIYFTVPLLFLVYVAIVSLIMNAKEERKWLLFVYTYYFIFLLTYDKIFDYYYDINFFSEVLSGNYFVIKLIMAIIASALLFSFHFLHIENATSQFKLHTLLKTVNTKNTDLREHKEELLQNVEELQRMQESLITGRAEKDRFLEAVSLGNMLIEYSIDGSVLKVNDRVWQVFQDDIDEFGSTEFLNLKSHVSLLEYVTFFDAIKDGEVLKKEITFVVKSKTYYTDFSFSPIYNEEGNVDRVIAIGRDSTASMIQKRHIEQQAKEIQKKNELLLASIRYAERIQNAMMKSASVMDGIVEEQFVLYKPKDIVSGDFHWVRKTTNKLFIGACDCTGHGVPGALVSIIGNQLLNRAIGTYGLQHPADILNKVAELLDLELNTKGGDVLSDGMDVALLSIDLHDGHLEFSGAFSPLYLASDKGVRVIKGDRKPIGRYWDENTNPQFTNHEVTLEKGEMIYLFSDGYMDQFGGPNDKKMGSHLFKEILSEIHHQPLNEQKTQLEAKFHAWMAGRDQVDDVLVMGVRL